MKIAMLICGLFFTIIGILIIVFRQSKQARCTGVTKGRITDIVKQRNRQRNSEGPDTISTSFYPVYEYTVGENTYIKKSSSGSSAPTFFIGQEVEIHYNPEKPDEYYANTNMGQLIVGIGMAIVGIGLTAFSFFIKI